MSDALVLAHLVRHLPVPALIADAGDDTSRRFLEFFTAKTRNRNTRAAYTRAVAQFARGATVTASASISCSR